LAPGYTEEQHLKVEES